MACTWIELSTTKAALPAFALFLIRRGNFITDDQITVVGTNNGVDWWCHTGGKFKNRQQGTFQVGPLQCSSSRQGLGIELQDGTQWTRMVTAGDFHVLPQGAAMRN